MFSLYNSLIVIVLYSCKFGFFVVVDNELQTATFLAARTCHESYIVSLIYHSMFYCCFFSY